jgi:hypothetical protein
MLSNRTRRIGGIGGARLERDGIEELKARVDLVERAERDAAGTAETDDG